MENFGNEWLCCSGYARISLKLVNVWDKDNKELIAGLV